MADLVNAGSGVAGQVQSPSQAGVQPGGKWVELNGGAEQLYAFAKTMAAQREHGARTRRPRIVRQVSGERECRERRGQIAVHMELDPSQGGQNGISMVGLVMDGLMQAGLNTPSIGRCSHRFWKLGRKQ